MDAQTASRLYSCMELHNSIIRCARRYFSSAEDRQDARQEAWIAITTRLTHGATVGEAKEIARRAIYATYLRSWRARRKENI